MRKHRPQQVYVHVYKYVRVRARARGAHTALAALFSRISRDVYTYSVYIECQEAEGMYI